MDAKTFLDNFGTIAAAPGGVDRLRELILHLAISGRLVDQLPSEEPVGLALAKVRAAKGNVLSAKMKGRSKVPREPEPWEINRDTPRGWCWARVDDTGKYVNGLAFKQGDWYDDGIPIIRIQNLTNPNAEFNYARGSFPEDRTVDDGDILVSWSATLEAFVWDRGPAVVNQHIFKVIPELPVVAPGFLYHLLRHTIRELAASDSAHGLAMKHINRGPFVSHVVGIPPLEEQERIVAKVNELTQLCDDLEARQQARHHVTTRLRASSLDALTNAESYDDLHTAWSRIHTNWEALTDHPDAVDALRQTVLQLAVEGRLANSDAADASADELLEAIKPGSASRAGIDRSLIPYDVPAGWRWVHLERVCAHVVDCLHKTPRYAEDGYPAIRTSDVEPGRILVGKARLVDQQTFEERTSRLRPAAGDVVYSREGGRFGIAAVVPAGVDLCLGQRMMQFRCADGVEPEYLCWFLNSPLGFGQASADVGGSASPHVNIKAIRRFLLPLPPSAEQRRIVARVRELMDQCDLLEAGLVARDRVGALLAGSIASAAAS